MISRYFMNPNHKNFHDFLMDPRFDLGYIFG